MATTALADRFPDWVIDLTIQDSGFIGYRETWQASPRIVLIEGIAWFHAVPVPAVPSVLMLHPLVAHSAERLETAIRAALAEGREAGR